MSDTPDLFRLDDQWEPAFIGVSVSSTAPPRFVYSLTKLVERVRMLERCSVADARDAVWKLVTDITDDHGDAAPLFIDDSTVENSRPSGIVGPNGLPV